MIATSSVHLSSVPVTCTRYSILATLRSMGSVSSTKLARMTVTADDIKKLIGSEKVVIFSKSSCPFCKMAKEKFDLLKQPYKAIELDEKDDCDQYQDELEKITGARTVPRVFVNGKFIGGGTDVKKMYESGELAKKLAE